MLRGLKEVDGIKVEAIEVVVHPVDDGDFVGGLSGSKMARSMMWLILALRGRNLKRSPKLTKSES